MTTNAEPIGWVTGERSTNRTDLHWGVGGTDLGIMWDDLAGHVLTVWGDTFNPRKDEATGAGPTAGTGATTCWPAPAIGTRNPG